MAGDEGAREAVEEVVVRRLEGFPALLRTHADGSMALEAPDGSPLPALTPGERLHITQVVPGDASYRTPARVVRVEPAEGVAEVHRAGDAERDQQRHAVRVRTTAIAAAVAVDSGGDVAADVHDISATGVRLLLERGAALAVGTVVTAQVDLPRRRRGDLQLRLDGEVVWSRDLDDDRVAVGIEVQHGDDDALASRLTRWVWDVETSRVRTDD